MSNNLPANYRGFDLAAIAYKIDQLFGFSSEWEPSTEKGSGSWEFKGKIVIDLEGVDQLCKVVEAEAASSSHVFRYVFGHLKAHHYQELYPTYSTPYWQDVRPYELDADLIAGWICANAEIPNAFSVKGMPLVFSDLQKRGQMLLGDHSSVEQTVQDYPWPAERELAFLRGARMWAAGRITTYNHAASRQGMADETFEEFLVQVPMIVTGMWSRPVPSYIPPESPAHHINDSPHGLPVSSAAS